MKKFYMYGLLCFTAIALVACGTENKEDVSESDMNTELGEPNTFSATQNNEGRQMSPFNQNYEEPSTLKISTTGSMIVMNLGGHSWKVELGNNETLHIEADSVHPSSFFNAAIAKPLQVNGKQELQFDFEPLSYDVIIWAEDGSNSTYGGIASIEERGFYVLEILAHFEQGTVSYSNMVELK